MAADARISERALVGRRLVFADAELVTKYTLPFIDATWRVAFIVFDLLGRPPRVLEDSVRIDGPLLRTAARTSDLREIESIPVDHFDALVHYDPWWAFRGISGVEREWIAAIFGTNIARPFRHDGRTFKMYDLMFSEDLARLEAVIAKDDVFRPVSLHRGDIDLFVLRRKVPTRDGNPDGPRRESPLTRGGHAARDGPGETGGPGAAGVPDRRRAQRGEALPLDESEPDEGSGLLQADVLRH